MQEIQFILQKEYITLGQLLKNLSLIDTGGMAKWYLQEYPVFVNDEEDRRRGRKLYAKDEVIFPQDNIKAVIVGHGTASDED